MDLALLKTAADYAAAVIRGVIRAEATTKLRWKKAVGHLQDAILQTQVYVSSLDRGEHVNRSREAALVTLWRTAATHFYGLDGDLAQRLQLKAEYWAEPESWTSQQVQDAGIALQHLSEYVRQLLYEST